MRFRGDGLNQPKRVRGQSMSDHLDQLRLADGLTTSGVQRIAFTDGRDFRKGPPHQWVRVLVARIPVLVQGNGQDAS